MTPFCMWAFCFSICLSRKCQGKLNHGEQQIYFLFPCVVFEKNITVLSITFFFSTFSLFQLFSNSNIYSFFPLYHCKIFLVFCNSVPFVSLQLFFFFSINHSSVSDFSSYLAFLSLFFQSDPGLFHLHLT